jgi:taurine dioxygenase
LKRRFVENYGHVKHPECPDMQIVPHRSGFGALVTVTYVEDVFSESSSHRLRQALSKFQVLIFKELTTELEFFQRLAQALGKQVQHDFVSGLSQDPYIHEIYKAPEHLQNFGGSWHSDGAYLAAPPTAVMLQALEVPEIGGDTVWSCQLTAYSALPGEMKEALRNRRIVHSASSVFGHYPGAENCNISMTAEHPVFRWIPERKKFALFHSGFCARAILGLPSDVSTAYLDALFDFAVAGQQYQHTWSPGDLVLWDNRTTMHRALNDYPGSARRMRRTLIGSQTPLPPPAASVHG